MFYSIDLIYRISMLVGKTQQSMNAVLMTPHHYFLLPAVNHQKAQQSKPTLVCCSFEEKPFSATLKGALNL